MLAFFLNMAYNQSCVVREKAAQRNAPLAQLVEHLTLNQGVQGSSPWRCTRENRFWRHRSSGDGSFFGFNFAGQTTLQSWEHMLY